MSKFHSKLKQDTPGAIRTHNQQLRRLVLCPLSYGGKLAENIVQAIARDLLADTMLRAHNKGIEIVMHVHDEIVAECETSKAQACLDTLNEIMAAPPIWAATLPLRGDGFITGYYKKD